MIIDINYWTKVIKRISIFALIIIGLYFAIKMACFYMPFLIAFIISLLIEPIIKVINKKTKCVRKKIAICVIIFIATILLSLLSWGIIKIISEASQLLGSVNIYFDKIYTQIRNMIESINFDKIQISQEILNLFNSSSEQFLNFLGNKATNILKGILGIVTNLPIIGINIIITLLATYFICTDRFYMIDQIEHHFPESWVKKFAKKLKQIISSLGNYLKAEAILIIISFVITIIGLIIMQIIGLNVEYPVIAAIGIGFVDALPILGSGTILVPWAVISSLNGDIQLGIALIILFVLISIVRQFMEPRVISKQIGMHPIFTLIAMYTGFKLIGIMGLLIGPIILIILKNVFETTIDKGVIKTIFDRK